MEPKQRLVLLSVSSVGNLMVSDVDNRNRELVESKRSNEVLSVSINFKAVLVGRNVQSRDVRNVLVSSLSLFFLELEGNTSNGSLLNSLH